LHYSVESLSVETMKYLVDNGADPNIHDKFGVSAL